MARRARGCGRGTLVSCSTGVDNADARAAGVQRRSLTTLVLAALLHGVYAGTKGLSNGGAAVAPGRWLPDEADLLGAWHVDGQNDEDSVSFMQRSLHVYTFATPAPSPVTSSSPSPTLSSVPVTTAQPTATTPTPSVPLSTSTATSPMTTATATTTTTSTQSSSFSSESSVSMTTATTTHTNLPLPLPPPFKSAGTSSNLPGSANRLFSQPPVDYATRQRPRQRLLLLDAHTGGTVRQPGQNASAQTNTTPTIAPSHIWDANGNWDHMAHTHPAGVLANVNHGVVQWENVAFINLTALLLLSFIGYPVSVVGAILAMTLIVSFSLKSNREAEAPQGASHAELDVPETTGLPWPSPRLRGRGIEQDALYRPCYTDPQDLSPASQKIYAFWVFFSSTIPCILVFVTPAIMVGLARPYPQEVFSVLVILCSVFIFSNGAHQVIFATVSIMRMRRAMHTFGDGVDDSTSASSPSASSTHPPPVVGGSEHARTLAEVSANSGHVRHWVILPQYKESELVVAMALDSLTQGAKARQTVSVVLAMEEREAGHMEKAERLKARYVDRLAEVLIAVHPANLPNDPPGKASNLCWAFKQLLQHLYMTNTEETLSNIVLTVADADSEFGTGYLEVLGNKFASAREVERYERIWQSPILHVKNYHTMPAPTTVGMMFTTMTELASLSDPNAIRFPYSSYSLSLNLARRVGGWDPDWIAEDYHMGIKCFLLTLGQSMVEPILIPTVNYMPEGDTWFGSVFARWSQVKRHALGFSDVSYYFSMLPLIFNEAFSSIAREKTLLSMGSVWRLMSLGVSIIIRLVNIHVFIGLITTYGVIELVLRLLMLIMFNNQLFINNLFDYTAFCTRLLLFASIAVSFCVAIMHLVLYKIVMHRIDGQPLIGIVRHFVVSIASIVVWAPLYMVGMGYLSWNAAITVLTQRSFEYEVAPKPLPCPHKYDDRREAGGTVGVASAGSIGESALRPRD